MFRMRRYRVFLIFAVIAIGALYHFTSLGDLENAGAASVEGLKNIGQKIESSASLPGSKPGIKDTLEVKEVNAPITVPSLAASGYPKPSQSTALLLESEALVALAKPSQTAAPSNRNNGELVNTKVTPTTKLDDEELINPKATPNAKPKPPLESLPSNKTSKPTTGPAEPIVDGGGGRLEIIAETGIPKIHWSHLPEHFPIPTESLIQLPTGKPKSIPKIQHEFAPETVEEKTAREEKRDLIRKAFSFSWAGYKKNAWMQDELSPVSGQYRNPFCNWAATLVDSLDTLYMLDLKDEFEEAVAAVKDIDFTTSPRNDIPLFETVIRYLGGLVAAYDISEGAHRILLDKAVELADILMGAFDTPNRMPMTFYLWKPTFASQPHRARTRVVLAELGSLSVEFTRLAQITKEAKYYDAIARITNEFEIWQNNTNMPGLWPQQVDASGCKKPDVSLQPAFDHNANNGGTNAKPLGVHDSDSTKDYKSGSNQTTTKGADEKVGLVHTGDGSNSNGKAVETSKHLSVDTAGPTKALTGTTVPSNTPAQGTQNISGGNPPLGNVASSEGAIVTKSNGAVGKRDINDETGLDPHPSAISKPPECEAQGLASPPYTSTEDFGIGGQADSTYEYLPKEYMLLGGLEDKYRTMYEAAADTITKELLYRAMIPDEKRRIMHPGLAKVSGRDEETNLKPEGTHLGCFAGGMYAVGAKIFGREGDMKIARELTDSCVWAYEATTTGIMPESYLAVQCPDKSNCPWNETLWHEKLDPFGDLREKSRLAQQKANSDAVKEVEMEGDKGISPQAGIDDVSSNPGKAESLSVDPDNTESPSQRLKEHATKLPEPLSDNISINTAAGKSETSAAEQSAEQSVSLPAGGASVEQPLSPPGDAAAPKSLVKRQLGDINEEHLMPSQPGMTQESLPAVPAIAATPGTSEMTKLSSENGTSALKTSNDTVTAANPTPQAAAYTPPPIPTREEFVKARIHDERLPEGMTKVTGPRYLLR